MYDTEDSVPRQEGRPKRPSAIFKNLGIGIGGLGVGYAGLKIGRSVPALTKSWQRTAIQTRRAASEVAKTAPQIAKATTETAAQIGKTAESWKPSSLMPKHDAVTRVLKKFWRGTLPSQVRKMQSGYALLEFAVGDYVRKYLVGEPMLAREHEPGWDPGVEAQVNAALLRRPPRSAKAEKMMVSEEGKKWKPGKGYKSVPGGAVLADEAGEVPGTSAKSIKGGVLKQLKDLPSFPKKSEPLPPDMLHGSGAGRPEFDPDVETVHGHQPIPELFDPTEAAKPTKVKFKPNLKKRKPLPVPTNEAEREALRRKVSGMAEAWRDPIAYHKAEVDIGLMPSQLTKHETRIPGESSTRFKYIKQEQEARHRAQEVRDVLAQKGWAYRKNVLNPLRAHYREVQGLAPNAPISAAEGVSIRKAVHPNPQQEIGKPGKVNKISPTPDVDVAGAKYSPATIRDFGKQFTSDVNKRVSYHKSEAGRIRNRLNKKIEQFTSPLAQGRLIKEDALDIVAKHFDPNRNTPIPLKAAHNLANYTGHTPEEIFAIHKAHRRHSYLGETEAGADLIRKQTLPKVLGRVPSRPGPAIAIPKSPILKRTGIGIGIAGGLTAGAYLIHKMRQNRKKTELEARCRMIRFQETDVYRDPTPLHRKEARRWLLYPESRAKALEKTIGRVQRIHRDIKAQKTSTGQIIDEKGRTREPEWRKPWVKKALIVGGLTGAALAGRKVYKGINRAGTKAALMAAEHHVPVGMADPADQAGANLISGHFWRAVKTKYPRLTGALSSASSKGGGLIESFKKTKKSIIERGSGAINKFTNEQVGELGRPEIIKEGGIVKKVKWNDPAAIKENMARLEKEKAKAAAKTASITAKEEQVKRAGLTRGSMQEDIDRLRKQREQEIKTSSLLRLVRFDDDGVYVPSYSRRNVIVREHYRSARSSQPQNRSKQYQRGFLTAAGIAGTGLGTAGGGYYVFRRMRQTAEEASNELKADAAKSAAEILKKQAATLRKSAKKGIIQFPIIKAQSRTREIRFQMEPDKKAALHDAIAGGIEGGVSYVATDKLLERLSERYPVLKKGLPRFGIAAGVGGVGTAVAGYGINRLIRKKIAQKKESQMSSKSKPIQFESQRTLVARDRYMKQIHERDVDRANTQYVHTALLGAGIGALARKTMPLTRAGLIGAGVGVGVQKLARIYGKSTRDQFGERSWQGKRVERTPQVIGGITLAGYGLKKLSKWADIPKPKRLSSRNRLIRFEEKKRHNLLAGAAIAAAGIPLYRGAGKFARAGGLIGKATAGHRVADYIEASQHVLNQGVTGKVAGMALRNPEHPAVKWALGKAPPLGELGSGSQGLNKVSRDHFSAFRSSHTSGLDAWTAELINHWQGKNPKVAKEIRSHAGRLQSHLSQLWDQGYNEKEALRHAANDPRHHKLFTRMIAYKSDPIRNYTKATAVAATVPAVAGAAVAATKRRDRAAR